MAEKFKVGQAPWEKNDSSPVKFKAGEAPWEKEEPSKQVGLIDRAEAALQGFGQSSTFGYLPQLQAAAAPALEKVYEVATGKDVPDSDYITARDEFINRDKKLASELPGSYLTGTVGGALATPGMAVAKGAGTLAKIGKAAGAGALTGAIYNPGDVEGEVKGLSDLQLKERGKQALLGAGTGAVAQGLTSGVSKIADAYTKKGRNLEKASDLVTLKSMGAQKGEILKTMKKNKVKELASFARDNNLVGAGKSVEATADGSKAILDDVGPKIKQVYTEVQDTVNSPDFLKSITGAERDSLLKTEFNPVQMSKDLLKGFEKEYKGKAGGKAIVAKVQNTLDELADIGETADIDQLLGFRRSVDELINFDKSVRDMSGGQQALAKLRDQLKDKIDDRIDTISKIAEKKPGFENVKGALSNLKNLNKRYSNASDIFSISQRATAGEQAKMTLGLPELIVGAGYGGADAVRNADSPEDLLKSAGKGLAAGAAFKLGRRYGPGALAGGLNKTSKVIQAIPGERLAAESAGLLDRIPPGLIGVTSEKLRRKRGQDESK